MTPARPGRRHGSARLYRIFLLAFPAATRRADGDEMARHFEHERAVLAGQPAALARLWIRAAADALWHGAADRLGRRLRVSIQATRQRQPHHAHVASAVRRGLGVSRVHQMFAVGRWSMRSLRATPLVSTLAILSLALGIGANTALFSIVNGLLLRPMPVRSPDSLLMLDRGSWSYPVWEEIRRRQPDLFDGAFAWGNERFDRASGGETEFVDGAYASGGIFEVLGLRAERGRLFTIADDVPGGGPEGPVAVISHRLWQTHFGGAGDVIGRRMTLKRVPFTIVGVLPARFTGLDAGRVADVYVPFGAEPLIRGQGSALKQGSWTWLNIMIRVRPGQTGEHANAVLRAVQPEIRAATMPEQYSPAAREGYLRRPFTFVPAATGRAPMDDRAPLAAMLAVVALVLLIACVNIANLLIARALARRHELGIRLALGGSRAQVAALLLGESLLLSAAGAGLGLLLAQWGAPLIVNQLSTWRQTIALDLSPDWRILAFTAGVSVATALLAGLAPAWSVTRISPIDTLGRVGRGVVGGRSIGVRGTLVAIQIALSVMLLVGAGLFLRTFVALTRAPLGFTPEPLLVADLDFEQSRVTAQDRPLVLARMQDAAAAVPGVTSAAAAFVMPTSGRGWNTEVGPNTVPGERMSWMNAVSPGWFATYDTPILAGRDFDRRDARGADLSAIVNHAFAGRYLSGPPVGQSVQLGGPDGRVTTYRIVGLAADALYRSPREGMMPTMYVSLAQRETAFPIAAVTVAVPPQIRQSVSRDLAVALHAIDPDVAFTFRTFDELIAGTVFQDRLIAMLSGFFGALALLLAGIGLYGVMSHAVGQRRAEIAVRMALGAEPAGIAGLVVRRFGLLVLTGIALGTAMSLWAGRFVQALLFQMEATDPVTIGGAVLVLVLVAALAAYLPARRAARLDPAKVLREG